MTAFRPQGETKPKAKAAVLMHIVYAVIALFSMVSFGKCASIRHISDGDLQPDNASAVNQNFKNIDDELSNTVHRTSTETIRGFKYFVNPVDFGEVVVDTATITSLTASTATVNNTLSMGGIIDMNSHKITELTNGTAATDAAAFGQLVLASSQIVKSDSFSSTTTGAWTGITGSTVSITPSATSSKVKVTFVVNGEASNGDCFLRVVRGTTVILSGDAAGNRQRATASLMRSDSANQDVANFNVAMIYMDSPATASQVSYHLQYYLTAGTVVINRGITDTDAAGNQRGASVFMLEEVRQ
jgi:hypothetical protein